MAMPSGSHLSRKSCPAFIGIEDAGDRSGFHNFTVIEPDGLVTELQEHAFIVGYTEEGFSRSTKSPDALEALFLKARISNSQHFIDDEDVRVYVDGDGEGKPDNHSAREGAQRLMDELPNAGEIDNGVEHRSSLALVESEQGSIQVDVFGAREVGMKTGPELKQRGHAALHLDPAPIGRS